MYKNKLTFVGLACILMNLFSKSGRFFPNDFLDPGPNLPNENLE